MPLSVIGAGLGRTGTMSLKLALEQLGFGPCYHMIEVFKDPAAPARWEAAADGERVNWEEVFAGFTATVDWPSASFYKELAAAYPQAKVILTERDPEEWYESTQQTIFAIRDERAAPTDAFVSMVRKVVYRMFDFRVHDRDWAISVFGRHNAQARAAFSPDRLLVYEVAQGWGPLCEFLGVPVPDGPMPKVNTTEEFRAREVPGAVAAS
ncbi:MAG: sulfotransferase family protein [Caulobacteraceae bacterium]|nr:sulfotransferase family protein [Caulobacteraceae bacterium]